MANVTASMVTVTRRWTENATNGRNRIGMKAYITGGGGAHGGTTNLIPATAFGLTNVEMVSNAYVEDTTPRIIPLVASPTGAYIHTVNLADATDATRANIADVTFTSTKKHYLEIHGY